MKKEIGQNIRVARSKNGYTQVEAASRLGVDINRYRKWEQGVSLPTVEGFLVLADFLNSSLDKLCGRVEEVGEITQDEQIILTNYRKASPQGKLDIMTISTIAAQTGN